MTLDEELVLIDVALQKFYTTGGQVEWAGPDGISRRVDPVFLQRRKTEIQNLLAAAAARASGSDHVGIRFESADG